MAANDRINAFVREYATNHISLAMYEDGSQPDFHPTIANIKIREAGTNWRATIEVCREAGDKLGEIEIDIYEQNSQICAKNVVFFGKTGNHTEA